MHKTWGKRQAEEAFFGFGQSKIKYKLCTEPENLRFGDEVMGLLDRGVEKGISKLIHLIRWYQVDAWGFLSVSSDRSIRLHWWWTQEGTQGNEIVEELQCSQSSGWFSICFPFFFFFGVCVFLNYFLTLFSWHASMNGNWKSFGGNILRRKDFGIY